MSMLNQQPKNLRQNQQGFASIVIALILIIVLSLITVGFAQLARREQQNALDKQLATQAYYAAESGINDIQQLINNAYANAAAVPSLASLTPPPGGTEDPNTCLDKQSSPIPGLPSSTVGQTGASYSCVLLNLAPPNLVWSSVSPDSERNITFSTTGALNNLTVYWSSTDNASSFKGSSITAGSEFTPKGGWGNSPAVVQVSLTPLAQLDRASMINNTFNVYLYPSIGGGSVSYDTANQGQVIGGHCNAAVNPDYPCSVKISNIPNTTGASEKYLIRVIDYYDPSNISVGKAYDSTGTQQLDFVDGQAQIDVTGRARNVLKRIQVRAPITSSVPVPAYSLEGQNVCKRILTYPSTTTPDTLPGCDLDPGAPLNAATD